MDLEEIRERLGNMEARVNKSEAWWLETPSLEDGSVDGRNRRTPGYGYCLPIKRG